MDYITGPVTIITLLLSSKAIMAKISTTGDSYWVNTGKGILASIMGAAIAIAVLGTLCIIEDVWDKYHNPHNKE